ncbi:hypothetical protein HYN56_17505 [Flavobacterium crocinum]|uniref:Carboxypeptidase regulatory-like domain-containing protein n=1 Tax=Flavobacterium crocinum TaxID=2183896 RepID=A0A2S1YPF5_9FLAO|nr:hypothetical protein [Flavobacterium crocinum]AWK05923.1 hypothetical protein HYN56_17505 [Flavobacterium crocinum]
MNTVYTKTCFAITLILVSFSFQSCLVNRCKRPQITGYVYDAETKQPIENCKVGETLSNQNGYFSLNEKRYHQFTFFAFEAPTLSVNEPVNKEGYESQHIQFMQPFGGGMKKGALHKMDTLYLKKTLIK